MNRQQRRAAARKGTAPTVDVPALLLAASAHHEAQRFGAAEALYRQILAADPGQADALHLLGVIAHQRGRHEAAVELIDRAIARNPGAAAFHTNRGNALHALGRLAAALAAQQQAARLGPDDATAHYNLARVLQDLDRPEDALAAYDAALRLAPNLAPAWVNRGNMLRQLGRPEEALASQERATALAGDLPDAWSNRGNTLYDLKRFDAAEASFRRALALRPDDTDLHYRLALAQAAQHRREDALENLETALARNPANAEAYRLAGSILASLARHAEAATCFANAVALVPEDTKARVQLGDTWLALRQPEQAIATYAAALAIDPALPYVPGDLLHARMQCCDWPGTDAAWEALAAGLEAGKPVATPFVLTTLPSTAEQQHRAALRFAADLGPAPQPPQARPRADGPIRVAYLSTDLHEHATAYLMAGVFEHHDPARIAVTALSYGPRAEDAMRARLRAAIPRFEEVGHLSDAGIAAHMRVLGIDIAVDLKGYTMNGRPGILPARGAPIQVSFLGFPGTLGTPAADYILADAVTIPPGAEAHYVEQVVRLPGTYQPYDRIAVPDAPSREAAGLPAEGVVFCCFNNSFKITPEIFDIWLDLLTEVPGSVLWLLESGPAAAAALRAVAATRGIAPERLVFAPFIPRAAHLARQGLADLALDTRPYNAHTTARDALAAGVPMVTWPGETFAARVGASLLAAHGVPELIATGADAYRRLALALAQDPSRRAALRARLGEAAPRLGPAGFAAALEQAYAAMLDRHLGGEPPAGFTVVA